MVEGHDSPGGTGAARRSYRVTSFDVAAAAGVSQSTVSRALAGDPVVSEATRARVAEAARRLNYHVDENAARLRTGRTGTLAVVVLSRTGENIRDFNPFYLALLGSICAAASQRGHETLVSFQAERERLWGRYQEQRKADGLIVLGTSENRAGWDYFAELAAEGAHMVCWGVPGGVRSDNVAGADLATSHLIAAGCRRIACIASETSPQRQFTERWQAHAAAMKAQGLQPRLVPITPGLGREEQGRAAIAAMLAASGGQPDFDGIFAACDEIALGAIHALAAAGIAVPGQVGVIGFDGIRAGIHSSPPLSTIEPDFAIAGQLLVDRLLALIAGQDAGEDPLVPVRLVPRGSTARN
ncbi:MAG: substrate-binding domain-containing protein [Proteobacteria bacterium]|nr:substrate-binding domain-containing protein [Pseudomonadota bacterium]